MTLTSTFILITILYDYEKAFYLKYRKYFNKFEKIQKEKKANSKLLKQQKTGKF